MNAKAQSAYLRTSHLQDVTREVKNNDGRSDDFSLRGPFREKNLSIPAAAGSSSPSMPFLVFWPLAGAWGAGEILPPCAQLLWCELYIMKDLHTKNDVARQRGQKPWLTIERNKKKLRDDCL